jgi:hypothetical protein
MVVHPKAGYYKCFSCGSAGDVITFVQRMEHLSFPAAARQLADQYGISLSQEPAEPARNIRNDTAERWAETAWWWARVRMTFVRWQHLIVDCERRATAYLAARIDAPDSPGIEYAWWWMVHGCELYDWLQGALDGIEEADPAELVKGYLTVRDKVRGRYLAEREMWRGFEREVRAGVMGKGVAA